MNNIFIRSIFDGIIHSILLFLLGKYSISIFSAKSYILDFLMVVWCTIFTILNFYFNVIKNNKKIFTSIIINIFSFIITSIFFFLSYFIFNFKIIPQRPLSNVDGIYILMIQGFYFISTSIIRLISLVVAIYKKLKRFQSVDRVD